MSFTFPKKEKLKSKKVIEKLFEEGKSVSCYPIKLLYLNTSLPAEVKIQAGVVVPKKNFKSAVKRNRIKRLLREGYRLNKPLIFNNIEGNYALLFLYLDKKLPQYAHIESTMVALMQKFIKQINNEKID